MGAAAAALSARALIDAGASALASFGFAGGLDPALKAGTIFLPALVVEAEGADGDGIETAPIWRQRLAAALLSHHPVVGGRLLYSPHVVATVAQKAALFQARGAAAVDMESLAVAQAARERRLPFLAVRVIIDGAADALPAAIMDAADVAGHVQPWRLLAGLARSPADLAALIRLARRYRAASRSLAVVAGADAWATFALP